MFVGETARTARQRSTDHLMHARTSNTHLSATAAHAEIGHEIRWEPSVLAKETHNKKEGDRNDVYIHKLDNYK